MGHIPSHLYFIAGGTGSVGSEVARRLLATGADVMLASRNRDRLEECAARLGARAVIMDATDPAAVTNAFGAALGEGTRLAGLKA